MFRLELMTSRYYKWSKLKFEVSYTDDVQNIRVGNFSLLQKLNLRVDTMRGPMQTQIEKQNRQHTYYSDLPIEFELHKRKFGTLLHSLTTCT